MTFWLPGAFICFAFFCGSPFPAGRFAWHEDTLFVGVCDEMNDDVSCLTLQVLEYILLAHKSSYYREYISVLYCRNLLESHIRAKTGL